MTKRRAHYVLSTHWDREWYQTFQDYRYRLVQLLDRVLDGLADGRLQGPFTCDGQTIILEDYLEVRPERRPQVEQFAREGKLVMGPWYVLPDEFLVSGESLIRNLRHGREVARAFGGKPSHAGFVCDIFGHNSQMPQILAGFGMRGGFIWRGLNAIETRVLVWRGADGTELPCYRFGAGGYCSYAFAVRHAREAGYAPDIEQAAEDIDKFLQFEGEHTEVDPILLFDGGDHQEWDQRVYALLMQRAQLADAPCEIVHTTLDDYLAEMLPQAGRITTRVEGELREPGFYPSDVDQQWLIPGVLSSRVWIKQANAECQSLLCQWAEPLSALAHAALGREYPQGYLNVAWRWLLKNHPHDSICGCSMDAVHEDMKYRFSQCRGIAERLTQEATLKLTASVTGDVADDELRVVLFNPLPRALSEFVEVTLQIPTDWPTFNEFFGFEPKPAFRIYGSDGQELPYQRLGQAMNRAKTRIREASFPQAYRTHDVRVSLPASIAALGYTTLSMRAGERGKPTRHPSAPGLATSERSMANAYLEVTVEPNGTLTLLDKRSGQSYTRLLTFEDIADIGDGWYHGVAVNDQAYVSTGCQADVALVHDGPQQATFRVRVAMNVPAEFRFDSMTRSDVGAHRDTPLLIDSLITLRAGSGRLEVQTTVHNTTRDHRLRVLLPSGAKAQTYLADSPFDVVERPIALRPDNHLYRELEVETRPQQSWTAVYDGARGLAVVSSGLLESAVRDLPERPIALTLLRATRRTVMTDGEPHGQLSGEWTFRYWIVPFSGAPRREHLCELGQLLAGGVRDAQLRAEDVALHRWGTALPPSAGFLRLEGAAVMTSARQVGDALEVRLWNPATEPVVARLSVQERPAAAVCPTRAQWVDLESNPLGPSITLAAGVVEVPLKPKQIVTVRLT